MLLMVGSTGQVFQRQMFFLAWIMIKVNVKSGILKVSDIIKKKGKKEKL